MLDSSRIDELDFFLNAAYLHFDMRETLSAPESINLIPARNSKEATWIFRARAMNLRKFIFTGRDNQVALRRIASVLLEVDEVADPTGKGFTCDERKFLTDFIGRIDSGAYFNGTKWFIPGIPHETSNHQLMKTYMYGMLLHSDYEKLKIVRSYGLDQSLWDQIVFRWVLLVEDHLSDLTQYVLAVNIRKMADLSGALAFSNLLPYQHSASRTQVF